MLKAPEFRAREALARAQTGLGAREFDELLRLFLFDEQRVRDDDLRYQFLSLFRDDDVSSDIGRVIDEAEWTGSGQRRFRDAMVELEIDLERIVAERALAGDPLLLRSRLERNRRLMAFEGDILGISRSENVVVLGCGAMPITAFSFIEIFGCTIRGVEVDCASLVIAERVAKTTGFAQHCRFSYGDAIDFDFTGERCIVVTGHCEPKAAILRRIRERVAPGARVLLRQSRGVYRYIYEPYVADDVEGFEIATFGFDDRFDELLLTAR